MTRPTEKSVAAFALFVALLVLVSAFCTERGGDFDELLLLNPAYTLAHLGKLTFPAYWFGNSFDLPVICNPPVHHAELGWLMRVGLPIYYAEAIPPVLWLLAAIAFIVRSLFPSPVKLGLLFAIGFLMTTGETVCVCFGSRPEGEIAAAWILGLVLLESGRLDNWNRRRLFAGSFFITWASGLHYYAAFAFPGVAVYMVWALRAMGWARGRGCVLALAGGGCLFGIPYLGFYVVPYFHEIVHAVHEIASDTNLPAARVHLNMYGRNASDPLYPVLLRAAMGLGVPLMVWSTLILAAIRSTRGLALAALPVQLCLFTLAAHKNNQYLVNECLLFAAAVAVGILVTTARLRVLQRVFIPVAAGTLVLCLVWGSPMLDGAVVSLKARVHESEVARAATRSVLGPNASVTGRGGAWFSSGAAYWHDIQADLFPGRLLFDVPTYFRNFDAVADFVNDSEGPLTTWYADGILKLRAFYFGESNPQLHLVLLSGRDIPHVAGYMLHNGKLFRFDQDPAGDYAVLTTICPPAATGWYLPWTERPVSVLRFPGNPPNDSSLVTALVLRSSIYAPDNPQGAAGRGCREVSRVPGVLSFADKEAMVARLRREDSTIHFCRILDEVPGYRGVGLPASAEPPADTAPVEGILDLASAIPHAPARIEHVPQLRVTLAPGLGSFSALLPVRHADSITGRCWVVLRLLVRSGHAGFAAFDNRKGIIARTPGIASGADAQTVALQVDDFRQATHIVVFNETPGPIGGSVDVLDASLLVPKPQRH